MLQNSSVYNLFSHFSAADDIVYEAITLNTVNLSGDQFVNFFLVGIVEVLLQLFLTFLTISATVAIRGSSFLLALLVGIHQKNWEDAGLMLYFR